MKVIAAVGNLSEGYTFYGPFADFDAAQASMDTTDHREWWGAALVAPDKQRRDDSVVYHIDTLDDAYRSALDPRLPWMLEADDMSMAFGSEEEACAAQRWFRMTSGFDPISGEPAKRDFDEAGAQTWELQTRIAGTWQNVSHVEENGIRTPEVFPTRQAAEDALAEMLDDARQNDLDIDPDDWRVTETPDSQRQRKPTSYTEADVRPGLRLACNGYPGTIITVHDGQLSGMATVRVPGGEVTVSITELLCFQNQFNGEGAFQ